jgi:hypothetical protein
MELINFDNLMAVLEEYAQEVRNLYQDNLIRNDRIATGDLLNSIDYQVQFNGVAYEVQLKLEDYWKYVEEDTKPHWPPVNKILEWISAKPIIPKADDRGRIPTPKQLAFLIGRKISRVGTEGSHDLKDAIEVINARYRDKIVYAIGQDTQVLTKVILGGIKGSVPSF